MKIRATLSIVALVCLLAIALALGSVLLLRVFTMAVLALLLGYLWTQLGIRSLTAQVKKSAERCQAGSSFDEEITVANSSRTPRVLVKVEENTDLPGYHNATIFTLAGRRSRSWQIRVYCRRRGLYKLGSLKVTSTDPFGFFSRQHYLGEPQSILVYPATLELPLFQPLSYNEPGAGPSRWLSSEVGPNASRVREYAGGDTLNRIHWRSTAHTGKIMVKEFDADYSHNAPKHTWIILDMNQASQAGKGDEGTEDCAVTIAASLIKKYVDNDHPVGLIATGDQSYLFPPDTESQHLWQVLEALALMKATGKTPIERLVSQEIERFDSNSVIIVVTPSATDRMAATLRQAINRGATVMIVSLDAASFGGMETANATAHLAAVGCRVYTVRQGDDLAKALDSRAHIPQRR
ncbi:MAG: DUF58 domain-containing protein [Chloroflexi bacterium]|nr:DUF58 domain-containing protein [Chloroflexota bacterium]